MSIECSFRHASLSGGYTSESWVQSVASLHSLTKDKNLMCSNNDTTRTYSLKQLGISILNRISGNSFDDQLVKRNIKVSVLLFLFLAMNRAYIWNRKSDSNLKSFV